MLEPSKLIDLLRASSVTFADSFRGVTPAQFQFKPGPDRWSIAETVEHVTIAEVGSGKLLRFKLLKAESPPEVIAGTKDQERLIDERLLRRDQHFPAPEIVLPTGRWSTVAEMLSVFEESRNATIDFLATTTADLTRHTAPHLRFGPLNGYQWGYFLARHCLRHVEQIEDVKRVAGYPQ